jgi:hypothetical protein
VGTVKVSLQGGLVPSGEEGSHDEAELDGRLKISVGSENEHFSLTGGFRVNGAEVSAVFAWGGGSRDTDERPAVSSPVLPPE